MGRMDRHDLERILTNNDRPCQTTTCVTMAPPHRKKKGWGVGGDDAGQAVGIISYLSYSLTHRISSFCFFHLPSCYHSSNAERTGRSREEEIIKAFYTFLFTLHLRLLFYFILFYSRQTLIVPLSPGRPVWFSLLSMSTSRTLLPTGTSETRIK